jgi:exosortase A
MDDRRLLQALLLFALAVWGWAYSYTILAIIEKWTDDSAYSHGFLILPISLWLAWRKRTALAATSLQPSVLGVAALLACTLAWMVARGSGVLVIEQFAAVAMVPALVLAALGWPATRVLIVPLAFLFFMVPFGRGLVPALMQVTADFSTLLLQWTGVPVYRTHMHISIPSGNFEVARACSGLNYFTTSLVLGFLYAYVNYRSWLMRAACVAAFVVIPVILNGLRVYFTILVSHLTEMRFGPGTEHVTFGRIFFVVMMLALFWIGRRWHDDITTNGDAMSGARGVAAPRLKWWPLPVACLLVLAGPPFVANSIARASEHLADREQLAALPAAAAGWQGPLAAGGRWRPLYLGGLIERQAVYQMPDGRPVDAFVAVYGLGTSFGAEMISYSNVIFPEEHGSLAEDAHRLVTLPDGTSLKVREVIAGYGDDRNLVWHWFVVGERSALNPFAVKALEALAFVTRSADSERIVAIHTPLDDAAADRLEAFIHAYGRCVALGFPVEACGG